MYKIIIQCPEVRALFEELHIEASKVTEEDFSIIARHGSLANALPHLKDLLYSAVDPDQTDFDTLGTPMKNILLSVIAFANDMRDSVFHAGMMNVPDCSPKDTLIGFDIIDEQFSLVVSFQSNQLST